MDRNVWISIPGRRHSDDVRYPPCSCSPPPGLVISAWYPTPLGLITSAQYSTKQLDSKKKVTLLEEVFLVTHTHTQNYGIMVIPLTSIFVPFFIHNNFLFQYAIIVIFLKILQMAIKANITMNVTQLKQQY